MTARQPVSPIMAAFRDRAEDGIPRFIESLIEGMSRLKLMHSGTGHSSEHSHFLTFSIQASLAGAPVELWSRIESALESWLNSIGVEAVGSSAYCNEFCLEVESLYQWRKRQGTVTLIITRLDDYGVYLHCRAYESWETSQLLADDKLIRIYADFNSKDEQGRVRLSTVGSLEDIEKHSTELIEGLEVILHTPGDFEMRGTLTFDGIWLGIPHYNTIRYYEVPEK